MSGRRLLARGAAVGAVFAVSFAVGAALDDGEPAPRSTSPANDARSQARVTRTAAARLGSLRLEPAPALPDLRAVPVERPPAAPARAAPARPDTPASAAESDAAPAPDTGYTPPAPSVTSPAPSNPAPSNPAPPANPPPSTTDAPQPASPTPAPDPAPAPAPAPTPDPSPSGGSGQYTGP
jgi:hypothetical protein